MSSGLAVIPLDVKVREQLLAPPVRALAARTSALPPTRWSA
jgi:hypothetical protein